MNMEERLINLRQQLEVPFDGVLKQGTKGDGAERTVKKVKLSKALTIPDGTTISDACRRMAARRVDVILLTDSSALLFGILTDKIAIYDASKMELVHQEYDIVVFLALLCSISLFNGVVLPYKLLPLIVRLEWKDLKAENNHVTCLLVREVLESLVLRLVPHIGYVNSGFDGDGALFPLAFGVVDEENDDNWTWFLSELHKLLETNTENMPWLTILSNRQQGIVDGVEANFPSAFHGFCMRHLSDSFSKELNNTMLVNLLWEAANAFTEVEFEAKVLEIEETSQDVAYWIRSFLPLEASETC